MTKDCKNKEDALLLKFTIRLISASDGTRRFGPGVARLIEGVAAHGSLRAAALDMGMSYSKAWRILHNAEQKLGFALLERTTGGVHGGGAALSALGIKLLNDYNALLAETEPIINAAFERRLGWIRLENKVD